MNLDDYLSATPTASVVWRLFGRCDSHVVQHEGNEKRSRSMERNSWQLSCEGPNPTDGAGDPFSDVMAQLVRALLMWVGQ